MNFQEVKKNAKGNIGTYCKVCPVCNGRACKNQIPGPGAKGVGDTAIRNYDKWQEVRLNMDTICENTEVDTGFEIFGEKFTYPIFAGPVGAVQLHYGDKFTDETYNEALLKGCQQAGIAAFTGDGTNPDVVKGAAKVLKNVKGIPTIKPWNLDTIKEKFDLVREGNPFAIAMDIDAAGLPFLKNMEPPAGSKTVEELAEIVKLCQGTPFIVKGIMTVRGALKAKEAGASAIIVSNHGGRVLDQCPSTAEVLSDIKKAVGEDMKIFVDGGIRSGADILKALSMGADAVLIARPYVIAAYGGNEEGVKLLTEKLGAELKDAMSMCGVHSLKEIDETIVF